MESATAAVAAVWTQPGAIVLHRIPSTPPSAACWLSSRPFLGVGQLYKEYLDELVLGDSLGYDGLVVNEHHSTFYSLMPACTIIAAALAVLGRAVGLIACASGRQGNPIVGRVPPRAVFEHNDMHSRGVTPTFRPRKLVWGSGQSLGIVGFHLN
jgi:hypothetical protein